MFIALSSRIYSGDADFYSSGVIFAISPVGIRASLNTTGLEEVIIIVSIEASAYSGERTPGISMKFLSYSRDGSGLATYYSIGTTGTNAEGSWVNGGMITGLAGSVTPPEPGVTNPGVPGVGIVGFTGSG